MIEILEDVVVLEEHVDLTALSKWIAALALVSRCLALLQVLEVLLQLLLRCDVLLHLLAINERTPILYLLIVVETHYLLAVVLDQVVAAQDATYAVLRC